VASTLTDLIASKAVTGAYYALPQGPDSTRNFWDPQVEAAVIDALNKFKQR
jgi:hypothetical protein